MGISKVFQSPYEQTLARNLPPRTLVFHQGLLVLSAAPGTFAHPVTSPESETQSHP